MVADAAEDGVATAATIQDLHLAMVDAGEDVVVEDMHHTKGVFIR